MTENEGPTMTAADIAHPHDLAVASSDLSRRRFLASAGTVAGVAAVGIGALDLAGCTAGSDSATPAARVEHGSLDELVAPRVPRLSIGYVEGSAGAASLREVLARGRARAVPAAQLRMGSPALSGQELRVGLLGLTPGGAEALAERGDSVLVDVLLPITGAEGTVPFFAWSFRPTPVPSTASPSSFTVAAARSHRFGVRVEARTPTPSAGSSAPVTARAQAAVAGSATQVLSSGFGTGLAKVRAGLYLLGLDHDAWDAAADLRSLDEAGWAKRPSLVLSVAASA